MPKFRFGTEKRMEVKRLLSPGPGRYKVRKSLGRDAKKITMSPCPRKGTAYNRYPGPGTYDPNSDNVKRRYPTYLIGTAQRRDLNDNEVSFPGPGQYNDKYWMKSTRIKSPSWRIGSAKQRPNWMKSNEFCPGVGQYNVSQNKTDGPKFSLRMKYKEKQYKITPGPADYSTRYGSSQPSWKIGTSTREDEMRMIMKENVPGPGRYSAKVRRKNSNNIKIGKASRDIRNGNETFPGPGLYKIPCEFDNVNDYTRKQGDFNENYRYV